MKLDCIDVFSGIGGLSVALDDFINTIQYCEIDKFCQQVLAERMVDGRLHRASIHSDIKTLYLCPQLKPTMICGGFPCQDVSSMGLKKGIVDGERSSLFFEIMRLVDEYPSIQVLFLENVSNIVKVGLADVVRECRKRGFNLQWTVKSASSMGAPHVRARWFMLATRGDVDLSAVVSGKEAAASEGAPSVTWDAERGPRVTFKPHAKPDESYDENWILRMQTLGNAVVPAVVRRAFVELATMHARWPMFAECLNQYSVPLTDDVQLQEYGLVYNNKYFSMPKAADLEDKKHSLDISVPFNEKDVKFRHFPTPRRGMTHASSLTERSLRDLPTVLVNSAHEYLREQGFDPEQVLPHTVVIANVNYVEWMMGYAKDWTKVRDGSFKSTSRAAAAHDTGEEEGEPRPVRSRSRAGAGGPKVFKYNGMHALMRDNPGLTVSAIAQLWKALSQEDREVYSARARDMGSIPQGELVA